MYFKGVNIKDGEELFLLRQKVISKIIENEKYLDIRK